MSPQVPPAETPAVPPETPTTPPVTPSELPEDLQAVKDQLAAAQQALATAQAEAKTYKERFVGLQGTYQREVGKLRTDADKLPSLTEQMAQLTTDHAAQLEKISELTKKLDESETEREIAKLGLERKEIIIKDFPELLGFEGEGLLPDGTGEELRTLLATFSSKLKGIGGEAYKKALTGAGPTPPPSSDQRTQEDAWKDVMAAMQKGDTTEYDKAYKEYLALEQPKPS